MTTLLKPVKLPAFWAGLFLLTSAGLVQAQFNWAQSGPIYAAGRARNMIIDKSDPSNNTFVIGSSSSGIFTTTTGGSLWGPLNDQGTVRNISYIAQAANSTIYAGTGEGFLRDDQKARAQKGTGLYKVDGKNLVKVADSSVTGTVINRVACHPTNSSIIALATNKGILISKDAGASFNPVAFSTMPTTVNLTFGMDVEFDSSGDLYCSMGHERSIPAATFGKVNSKVFRSTDGSLNTFKDITPSIKLLTDTTSAYGRIEIAVAPSNKNVVYVSCAKKYNPNAQNSSGLNGLFVSYNAGESWGVVLQGSPQLDPLSFGVSVSTGDYAHTLKVVNDNPDAVFLGGYTLYFFTRTGGTNQVPIGSWFPIGSPIANFSSFYLKENVHDVTIVPGSNPKFYFVTDAGIYRSIDLHKTSVTYFPSIQPFYKGFVTGQFNSVSIERYPVGQVPSGGGSSVTPFVGFVGGTTGNGLNYFSGTHTTVTREVSYLPGRVVYNAEYSKILSDAAFFTASNGDLYRTSNAKTSAPVKMQMNTYTANAISRIAPSTQDFGNSSPTSAGTLFRLWETYGQVSVSPDSLVFYNDTVRLQASMIGIQQLTTSTTFTFSSIRPSRVSVIDSIVIRTGTVTLPTDNYQYAPPFTNAQDLSIKLTSNSVSPSVVTVTLGSGNNTTTATYTVKVYTGANLMASGPVSTLSIPSVTLNESTNIDAISVTFNNAPFETYTVPYYPPPPIGQQSNAVVPDAAAYYKVFATIFYKYAAGDTVFLESTNISTKSNNYVSVLPTNLNWAYGSITPTILAADVKTAIPSPTYVLKPGNVSQTSPNFTVNAPGLNNYTITQYGTYTINAVPVNYVMWGDTAAAIPNPTYVLNPGNISQSTASFVVTPTVLTDYTITATGSGTLTAETYTTVDTPTYVLNPGNVSQSSTVFLVTPTVNTTYTVQGLSSNTLAALNTSTTRATQIANTFSATGSVAPFAPNNKPVKVPNIESARIAVFINHASITNARDAIVVCKSPLELNDPLSFVRVSQSGCYRDDSSGNPTTSTISIDGKPNQMEWSKQGTELYYSTLENNGTSRLYRVSHINTIMDLTPLSYSGKFFNDIFKYSSPPGTVPNPVSPFRTTLLGTFDKPITALAVSNDDKTIVLTFNNPAQTGTTGIVMRNQNDCRKSDFSNINWVSKDAPGLKDRQTYCVLLEKSNNNSVFIGTDNGIFFTSDIGAATPAWSNVNNDQLPNIQVYDIRQQILNPWDCYNSGQIYVATAGRGVWTTGYYFAPHFVGIEETGKHQEGKYLNIFPNPANGEVTVQFNAQSGESATINVMDISGRFVKNLRIGNIEGGDFSHSFSTNDLNPGVYIINIQSTSGIRRVAKMVIAR